MKITNHNLTYWVNLFYENEGKDTRIADDSHFCTVAHCYKVIKDIEDVMCRLEASDNLDKKSLKKHRLYNWIVGEVRIYCARLRYEEQRGYNPVSASKDWNFYRRDEWTLARVNERHDKMVEYIKETVDEYRWLDTFRGLGFSDREIAELGIRVYPGL